MTCGRELYIKALRDINTETAICLDIISSRGINVDDVLIKQTFLIDIRNIIDDELSDGT